jgi:hypothetical protein
MQYAVQLCCLAIGASASPKGFLLVINRSEVFSGVIQVNMIHDLEEDREFGTEDYDGRLKIRDKVSH